MQLTFLGVCGHLWHNLPWIVSLFSRHCRPIIPLFTVIGYQINHIGTLNITQIIDKPVPVSLSIDSPPEILWVTPFRRCNDKRPLCRRYLYANLTKIWNYFPWFRRFMELCDRNCFPRESKCTLSLHERDFERVWRSHFQIMNILCLFKPFSSNKP